VKEYSILLVEDEKGTQEELSDILEFLFKNIYLACDGVEAKELYLEHSPDLIITDIQMPKLSGLELIRWIRQTDQDTDIVIVSAYTNTDYLLLATELGLLKYLVKPITKSKLDTVLKLFKDKREAKLIYLNDTYQFLVQKSIILFGGTEYKLSQKESNFLSLLLRKKSLVNYYELEDILDIEFNDNARRQFIKKLRQKLPKDYLRNIQNSGYIINNRFLQS
jgi:YesN/AraC family two-component response regulator